MVEIIDDDINQLDRNLKSRRALVLLAILLLGGVGSGGLYSVVSTSDRYTATQANKDLDSLRESIRENRSDINFIKERVRRNERDIDRLNK